ncbi:MAG: iron-sulfur cluster assembly accessory protein [Thiofilum sp.]|uniref:HesB/IscA family protein n=1 Tax=Thiofilum sp. TaxID=2212733 RepID=UPI0025D9529E|nr:iron-sulfur cluster assembly accessory protein [Thiofilum sp.]MBK8452424.1 iron-sulfur cluster assembly accessory protein [Thiofilum sp.]
MITITPNALQQVKLAASSSNATGLALRIEIQPKADGSFNYLMGFDEQRQVGDVELEQDGVKVLIGKDSKPLAQGMVLDFVELNGQMEFIFLNPNDPYFQPPKES